MYRPIKTHHVQITKAGECGMTSHVDVCHYEDFSLSVLCDIRFWLPLINKWNVCRYFGIVGPHLTVACDQGAMVGRYIFITTSDSDTSFNVCGGEAYGSGNHIYHLTLTHDFLDYHAL